MFIQYLLPASQHMTSMVNDLSEREPEKECKIEQHIELSS